MEDYVRLQVNGEYEPGYFTEHEENEEEEERLTDDPPVNPSTDEYNSSFQQWFNLMLRRRRDRRNAARQSPDDDRDDVDGSKNTASETDVGNFPPVGVCPGSESDHSIHEPDSEPDHKRQRTDDNDPHCVQSSSSGSMPPLINAAAAIPCAAANPLSLVSHPLYQQGNGDNDDHAVQNIDDDTNDHQADDSNRDHASATRRTGSSFQ